MQTVATLTFGIASSVAACVGAAAMASLVMANSEAFSLDPSSASDLWSVTPVRVDRRKQKFERLPPAYSSYVTEASAITSVIRKRPASGSAQVRHAPQTLSTAHLDWCATRYRSFNATTNSYRAYSGETRTCTSPFAAEQPVAEVGTGPSSWSQQATATGPNATAWCALRYRSYRVQDNTYQPYGGPRRQCRPPLRADIASAGE